MRSGALHAAIVCKPQLLDVRRARMQLRMQPWRYDLSPCSHALGSGGHRDDDIVAPPDFGFFLRNALELMISSSCRLTQFKSGSLVLTCMQHLKHRRLRWHLALFDAVSVVLFRKSDICSRIAVCFGQRAAD